MNREIHPDTLFAIADSLLKLGEAKGADLQKEAAAFTIRTRFEAENGQEATYYVHFLVTRPRRYWRVFVTVTEEKLFFNWDDTGLWADVAGNDGVPEIRDGFSEGLDIPKRLFADLLGEEVGFSTEHSIVYELRGWVEIVRLELDEGAGLPFPLRMRSSPHHVELKPITMLSYA